MYANLIKNAVIIGAILTYNVAFAQANPETLFAAYVKSVEAGDAAAIPPLISESASKPPFFTCPEGQDGRACLITYILNTVVLRHTKFEVLETRVDGDVIFATLEVRNDLTRAAGVERFRGIDRIMVKDGKIVEFAFLRDEKDAQTMKFFEFISRRTAPSTP